MDRLIEIQMANIEKAYESIPMGGKLEFSKSAIEGIHQVLRELKEYKDLEENGLLIKLPCKLNDTIYIIGDNDKIDEAIVDGFEIRRLRDRFEIFILIPIYDDIRQTGYQTMSQESVFLTREAAELKLMKGE